MANYAQRLKQKAESTLLGAASATAKKLEETGKPSWTKYINEIIAFCGLNKMNFNTLNYAID